MLAQHFYTSPNIFKIFLRNEGYRQSKKCFLFVMTTNIIVENQNINNQLITKRYQYFQQMENQKYLTRVVKGDKFKYSATYFCSTVFNDHFSGRKQICRETNKINFVIVLFYYTINIISLSIKKITNISMINFNTSFSLLIKTKKRSCFHLFV